MTFAGAIVLLGIVLVPAFFLLGRGRGRAHTPGPHNNWRRHTSTLHSSGWSENFPGCGTDGSTGGDCGSDGGSSGGGGSD